jgi:hypothetical protein
MVYYYIKYIIIIPILIGKSNDFILIIYTAYICVCVCVRKKLGLDMERKKDVHFLEFSTLFMIREWVGWKYIVPKCGRK